MLKTFAFFFLRQSQSQDSLKITNKDLQEMLITWMKTNNIFGCDPNFRSSTLSLPNNSIENISTEEELQNTKHH